MKFKMNGRQWRIKKVPQHVFWEDIGKTQTPEDGKYYGRTMFILSEIWLDDSLPKDQALFTLRHELMHCYIGSYITVQSLEYNEELLCDISSNAHEIIDQVTNKYFK